MTDEPAAIGAALLVLGIAMIVLGPTFSPILETNLAFWGTIPVLAGLVIIIARIVELLN